MKGLELHMNGKIISAGPRNGNVMLIANAVKTMNRDELSLSLGGYSMDPEEYTTWVDTKLKMGDRVKVKVVGVEENSEPIKTDVINAETTLENKLKSYLVLKEELEDLGLI